MNRYLKAKKRINTNFLPTDVMNKEDWEHLRTIYDALEKQIPQEPCKSVTHPYAFFCPKCGEKLIYMLNHCGYCGQAISWMNAGGKR